MSAVAPTTARRANQETRKRHEGTHTARNVRRGEAGTTKKGRGARSATKTPHIATPRTREASTAKIGVGRDSAASKGDARGSGRSSFPHSGTTKGQSPVEERTVHSDGQLADSKTEDGGSLRRVHKSRSGKNADESHATSSASRPPPDASAKSTAAEMRHPSPLEQSRGENRANPSSAAPAGGVSIGAEHSSHPGRSGAAAVASGAETFKAHDQTASSGITRVPRLAEEASARHGVNVTVVQLSTPESRGAASNETANSPAARHGEADAEFDAYSDADLRAPSRLVCTSGSRATSEKMLPPDGICDRLFYTDVVWREMAVRGSRDQPSWEAFQRAARAATKTGHGLSVDYGQADKFFATMTTSIGEKKLRELFDGKVTHYGVLKADATVGQLLEDIHGKLGVLKILKQLQDQFARKNEDMRASLDLVLGVKFRSYKSLIDSSQHSSAMTALANHLPVTIFVVHTHIQDWKMGSHPAMGTIWQYGNDASDKPNEPSLKLTAKELSVASIPMRTYVMPSFTLMVAKSEQQQNSDKSLNDTYVAGTEFTQLCSHKSNVSIMKEGIIKQSVTDHNLTYTYEDAETMTTKAKAFFKLYNHARQGWAVFDTDYDDYDNSCGDGSFNRLTTFKATLDEWPSHVTDSNKA
ncbi:uncharacterized protein [Dermacentor andersoni]|uniref:uncharacterized protein n=1 Tax=Dermacentor andersoni TaxID=34620 RepID=UPI002417A5C1|nr:uncharacterized protein LOC126531843 [Dermacentor andersoni]